MWHLKFIFVYEFDFKILIWSTEVAQPWTYHCLFFVFRFERRTERLIPWATLSTFTATTSCQSFRPNPLYAWRHPYLINEDSLPELCLWRKKKTNSGASPPHVNCQPLPASPMCLCCGWSFWDNPIPLRPLNYRSVCKYNCYLLIPKLISLIITANSHIDMFFFAHSHYWT